MFENHVFLREDQDDIPATEFLPHSERHELGSHIDRLVIPGLLKSIAGTGDRHIIRLSANSLLDFSFPSWFQHQTKELGAQGSQLIIQIPADLAVSNTRQCQRLINDLKPGGVGFSLDEFGASNRHFELLDMLDIELVRLSSGLSESLKSNTSNQDKIKNIAQAAAKVGAMVVAGNVQDTADMATLWQCGVKLVCGDFLSEPLQING
ncbi:MAG: EAL domain-containing protein [Xanthomonadales bacterium]|nr:EAL domain-containing protein [Xanthomonadales bacterium]